MEFIFPKILQQGKYEQFFSLCVHNMLSTLLDIHNKTDNVYPTKFQKWFVNVWVFKDLSVSIIRVFKLCKKIEFQDQKRLSMFLKKRKKHRLNRFWLHGQIYAIVITCPWVRNFSWCILWWVLYQWSHLDFIRKSISQKTINELYYTRTENTTFS